jgi:hypothetical protein
MAIFGSEAQDGGIEAERAEFAGERGFVEGEAGQDGSASGHGLSPEML